MSFFFNAHGRSYSTVQGKRLYLWLRSELKFREDEYVDHQAHMEVYVDLFSCPHSGIEPPHFPGRQRPPRAVTDSVNDDRFLVKRVQHAVHAVRHLP